MASCLAVVALAGCAALGDVTTGVCGNGVVERGEDCDQKGDKTSGNACGQPNLPNACRFICAHAGGLDCPPGWLCGVDGICRQAVTPPSWTPASGLVPQAQASEILVADFDRDGVSDVVAVSAPTVGLHFFDTNRTSTTSGALIATSPHPAVGRLTPQPLPDGTTYGPSLALNLAGLAVFTGETDRTLTASTYISVSFATGHFRITPYVIDDPMAPGLPLYPTGFFVYDETTLGTFLAPSTSSPPLPFGAGQLRAGVGIQGRFAKQVPCGQFAMAFNEAGPHGHVRVYAPACDKGPVSMGSPSLLADVALPPMVPTCADCQPLHLHDVDLDGHPDLVVTGFNNQLYVAYSDGTGQFWPTPAPWPSPAPDMVNTFAATSFATLPMGSPPLAIGDLNGDCVLDIVDATNIYIGVPKGGVGTCVKGVAQPPAGFFTVAGTQDARTWTEAIIADVNADGLRDVVVGSSSFAGITVFRGTGTALLNSVEIVTEAPTKHLAVGDFDGDLVNDLVFAQIGEVVSSSTAIRDTVFLAFGAKSGPPDPPVPIGNIDSVTEIVPAFQTGINTNLILNPFVVSWGGAGAAQTTSVYLFPGNSARQIDAPYFLLGSSSGMPMSSSIDGARRMVIGSFTGRAQFNDIAVFARCNDQMNPMAQASCFSRLWLLPTLGGAAIEPADATDSNAPRATKFPDGDVFAGAPDALIANLGPSTGSKADEIVLATSPPPPKSGTFLTTAKVNGSAFMTPATAVPLAGFDLTRFDVMGAPAPPAGAPVSLGAQMLTADVDGDGHLDVVLAAPRSGLAVVLWKKETQALDVTGATKLTYGDLAKNAKCGYTPNVKIKPSIGVAALRAAPAQQPLVVVLPGGSYLMRYDTTTKKLVPSCLKTVGGGFAVASGDFDGDGIEDIVVSERSGLNVFYGDSLPPGGATGATNQAIHGDGGAP